VGDVKKEDTMSLSGPVITEHVYGRPIQVYGRTLTPVARVISMVRHRGTIRERRIEGVGGGVVSIQPARIIEEHAGRVSTLAIRDSTASMIRYMALAAVIVPLLALALIWFDQWMRER
jgi:hypothetical protein